MKEKKNRRSFLKDLFQKKPLAAASLIFLVLLFVIAVFADYIAPYPMQDGAMQVDVFNKMQKPYLFMNGAEKAGYIAGKTLRKVYKKVGFVQR